MKKAFEPRINCGYLAGENPMCWDGNYFETYNSCDKWIENHEDDFSANELGGCVYPHEVEVFEVGDKVKWYDPAHSSYQTPTEYARQCERVMTIYDVSTGMVKCSDEYGEVEAYPCELELVTTKNNNEE